MADLVVIIACRDSAAVLPRQLAALDRQTDLSFRVLLSDKGSSDDTVAIAQTWQAAHEGIEVIDSSQRRGAAHARNVAIQSSAEPFILVCDGDDAVSPRWVASMRHALRTAWAATGPLELEFPDNPSRQVVQNSSSVPVSMNFLPYMPGCNMAFRREAYDTVGGFDPGLPIAQEDVDFGWRLAQAGFDIVHALDASIRYRQRVGSKLLFQQWRYGRAHAHLYAKHRHHQGIPSPASNKTSFRWFIEWAKQLPGRTRRGEIVDAAAGATFQAARWLESLRVGPCPL